MLLKEILHEFLTFILFEIVKYQKMTAEIQVRVNPLAKVTLFPSKQAFLHVCVLVSCLSSFLTKLFSLLLCFDHLCN